MHHPRSEVASAGPPLAQVDAPTVAEFFAGIGLVRLAVEQAGFSVRWANDIEPIKERVYRANFDASHYLLGDVRAVDGRDLPTVDLATASFPCVDLSLAGWRRGLAGDESGMFWEFARVIKEMGDRSPAAILLENVPGFATSHGGSDLASALERLNSLGYICDLLVLDAVRFIPQSRPRLFVVATKDRIASESIPWGDPLRPKLIHEFVAKHRDLKLQFAELPVPVADRVPLGQLIERKPPNSSLWWDERRTYEFVRSLNPLHQERLTQLIAGSRTTSRTAYRRTRGGVARWEIRSDDIAGCLRTARGGSSKQAVLQAGRGRMRVRWMTAREYARLQGAGDLDIEGVSETQAMFGLGDAVCVPAVAWIAKEYLHPYVVGGVVGWDSQLLVG